MRNPILTKVEYLLIVMLLGCFILSCEGNDPDENNQQNTEDQHIINDWILENMELYYLWNDEIPQKTDPTLAPADYFESLLSSKDRFSWIQENFIELQESFSGISMEAGYDFNLALIENSSQVVGYITYIKPNSPASRSPLKRGDFFLEINGKQLTESNYLSLINATSSAHTLGIAIGFPEISRIESISLSVEKYEENPILLDTIYRIDNKKIGYIVYNFFAPDNGDGSISYEKELNNLFGKFQGVDDLILDLRYNSGGYLTTALSLTSMISERNTNDIFSIEVYNSLLNSYLRGIYGPDYNKTYFVDSLERYNDKNQVVERTLINKLGMNKLHVITSSRTASASEILINVLKAYIDVIIIGGTTVGKNVGSITIYEEDAEKQKTNKWGLQPIVVKFANKKGFADYEKGFAPNRKEAELNSDAILLPLGDTNERLLQAALDMIAGNNSLRSSPGSAGKFQTIASSADRTPARKNTYIDPRKVR
jgi:C-terminal processing protease CtpA/Prc